MAFSFFDLYSRVSDYLGTGSSPTGAALTTAQEIVNSGIRRFLMGHNWTFKRSIQVGTLTLASGVQIATLPADFVTLLSDIVHNGPNLPMTTFTDDATVLRHLAKNTTAAAPYLFAVIRAGDPGAADAAYALLFSPIPDTTYTVSYTYEQQPADLVNDADVPWGSNAHSETILLACLSAAEQYQDDEAGLHTKNYEAALAQSIALDQKLAGTKFGTGNAGGTATAPTTVGPTVQGGGNQ